METLAIIAYKQPLVRSEIELIRGVDTAGVLKTLLDRRLIRIVGRKDIPGRPIMYGTFGASAFRNVAVARCRPWLAAMWRLSSRDSGR